MHTTKWEKCIQLNISIKKSKMKDKKLLETGVTQRGYKFIKLY